MTKRKVVTKTASAKKSTKKAVSKKKPAKTNSKAKSTAIHKKKVVKKALAKKKMVKKTVTKKKVAKKMVKKTVKKVTKKAPAKNKTVTKKKSASKKSTKKSSPKKASTKTSKKTTPKKKRSKNTTKKITVTKGDENLPMLVPDYKVFKQQAIDLPDLDDLLSSEEPDMNTDMDFSDILSSEGMPEVPTNPIGTVADVPPDPAKSFPSKEKKEKNSLFGGLFKHKKKEVKAKETIPPIEPFMPGFVEDTQDFQASEAHPHEREKVYIENMKRRIDNDNRERLQHVQAQETSLEDRHEELEVKETDLLKREADTAAKEDQFADVQKLQQEVEDQKISLEYQKQQIEELKSELALKDHELKEREIQLDAREEDLKQLETVKEQEQMYEHEVTDLHKQVDAEDDAIEYLQEEIENQRKSFEEQMADLQMNSQAPSIVDELHHLITECYVDLAHHNIQGVKAKYNEIRERYMSEAKEFDTAGELYKDVHTLYEDIKNSVGK
jgi:hypothetical protein